MIFPSILTALVTISAAQVPANLSTPTVIVDSRWEACDYEEQKYFTHGKAERRLTKVESILLAENIAYRVVRWRTNADVPAQEAISAMGPKKYLRNC